MTPRNLQREGRAGRWGRERAGAQALLGRPVGGALGRGGAGPGGLRRGGDCTRYRSQGPGLELEVTQAVPSGTQARSEGRAPCGADL